MNAVRTAGLLLANISSIFVIVYLLLEVDHANEFKIVVVLTPVVCTAVVVLAVWATFIIKRRVALHNPSSNSDI